MIENGKLPRWSKCFLIHITYMTLPPSSLACVMSTWCIIVSFLYHNFEQECHSNFWSFCFLSLEPMFNLRIWAWTLKLGFCQFGFLWFVYVVVDSWIVGLNWSSQCSWVHFLLSSFRSHHWHIHYLEFVLIMLSKWIHC